MKQLGKVFAVAVGVGVMAACGDAGSTGDPLSDAEVQELAAELVAASFTSGSFSRSGPLRAPAVEITLTINETNACEGGGTVTVNGTFKASVNDQTGSGTFTLDYTSTPNGCVINTSSGKVFTVTGDPNIKVNGTFDVTQTTSGGTVKGDLTHNGKFKWTSNDGRAGGCGIALKVTYNFTTSDTSTSGSATMSGTACGTSINRTVSVSA